MSGGLMKEVRSLEETTGRQLVSQLGNFGLEVSEFNIKNLSLPEEYQRALERQGIKVLETQSELAKLEQMKKMGVDVNKLATMEKVAEKATGLHLVAGDYVAGDYVAGPAIHDSVLLRSNVGTSGKVEDSVLTNDNMTECPTCKTALNARIHKFCYQCGAKVRVCSNCHVAVPEPGRFCYECGKALV
jgi:membrane protease subunit (stomatin/prohibitin family)